MGENYEPGVAARRINGRQRYAIRSVVLKW